MKRMVACDLLWLAAASCLLTLVFPSTTHQGECLLIRDPRCSRRPGEGAEEGRRKGCLVGSKTRELETKTREEQGRQDSLRA